MSTKDTLLKYLKESAGIWVSGESIAAAFMMSRSAIWKHIKALQEEGYGIDSSTRRGYLLRSIPDLLLPAEIRDGMGTALLGRERIEYFRETDSTNLRARALAHEGAGEGTIVVAETQTQGRGRRGRTWFSPEGGGIYISILLRPRVSPHDAPQLTLMTAVAMADTLRETANLPFTIKWPNDILVHGKKISGILTEMSLEADHVDYVVIGVGLNVNTPEEAFNNEIHDIATSLRMLTGKTFSRVRILQSLLRKLEQDYSLFQEHRFEEIRQRWKELSGIIGKRVKIEGLDHVYEGEVIDIDRDGFLMLKLADGTLQRIVAGDVLYL